jgi:glycerate 2-kinase
VSAVEPSGLLGDAAARGALARWHLDDTREPRLFLVAAGKAAWPMARAFMATAPAAVRAGVIAGPRTREEPLVAALEWFAAGHPSPNAASVSAGQRALALARASREIDGRLLVLLSGGASAMLAAPAAGVTLEDKIAAGRALMLAGVPIDELNCVRKHLSDVKGGQLAGAAARTFTLAISDVHAPVPDDPAVIGSGPTVADPTTFAEALEIAARAPGFPERARARLERGSRGELPETIKPGDPRVTEEDYRILANRATALAGARRLAESLGYRVSVVDDPVAGEARDAARSFVTLAAGIARQTGRPSCVLGAGETTVTVKGRGRGGRNQEFALAAAPVVASIPGLAVLASAGTDGVDGPTDAAGAIVDSTTLARARAAGLDGESTLAANDAYHFFRPLGDLITWGPTGTNVGDVQLLLTVDRL